MGSRRAARPSRSHARPSGGRGARGTALLLGAVAVTAGVGITLATLGGEDGGRSDRVAASDADDATGAADAADRPSPSRSAAPSASASVSSSPSRSATTTAAAKRKASPTRTAGPTAGTSSRAAATGDSGDQSAGSGDSSGSGAGGGSGDSGADSGSGTTSGSGGPEARVLALVNEERAAAGCSPVTENARLTRAADDYSDVMAASGVMSHTGPDGSTMASRVEAAGYLWSALGENIARGQADAAAVMEAWMNSSGHRANILNCDFAEIGIGVHAGDGGPWWTQDFGTGR
ncbi:CAP domain-containing protein [Streptomyces sp. NPDC023723]|uniref:CAP domain-containing protein n=1 Tax=Streptomyces sp. NPDC023723 TaxID=3154323 RepID=UPI0033CFF745